MIRFEGRIDEFLNKSNAIIYLRVAEALWKTLHPEL